MFYEHAVDQLGDRQYTALDPFDDFTQRWGQPVSGSRASESAAPLDATQVNALGAALRELDALRQEGLMSELEFEQKRRQLLGQVA